MDEAEKLQARLSEALSRLDQAVADRLQRPADVPELSELQRRTDQVSERLDKAIKQLDSLLGD